MKFPLSLDLRNATLARAEPFLRVIDADNVHVMSMMADDIEGNYNTAGLMVDMLNATRHSKPEDIRDISVEVYKKLLDDGCKGDAQRMLDKDREKDPKDDGKKMRSRAGIYDRAVRATLEVLSERG